MPGRASKGMAGAPHHWGRTTFLSGSFSEAAATSGSHHTCLEPLEQHGEWLGAQEAAVPTWGFDLQKERQGSHHCTYSAHCFDAGAAGCQQDPRVMILGHQGASSHLVTAQLWQLGVSPPCPRAVLQP